MIRFAVLLFFFIHLAILLRARNLAWLGRITGWGTFAVFVFLYVFQVEENSDLTFVILAGMTGISMALAEIVAANLRRKN